jgi:hypothetical protein
VNTGHLLRDLKKMLVKTIQSGDQFLKDDMHYFENLAHPDEQALHSIRAHVEKLRRSLTDLEYLMECCTDNRKEVSRLALPSQNGPGQS